MNQISLIPDIISIKKKTKNKKQLFKRKKLQTSKLLYF